jgi:hypothetical protein
VVDFVKYAFFQHVRKHFGALVHLPRQQGVRHALRAHQQRRHHMLARAAPYAVALAAAGIVFERPVRAYAKRNVIVFVMALHTRAYNRLAVGVAFGLYGQDLALIKILFAPGKDIRVGA